MNFHNSTAPSFRSFGRKAIVLQARPDTYLTNDDMRRAAPTIFADHAHDSRSERYVQIPTFELLDGMANAGFFPVKVQVGGSSDVEKRNFTKHMIRFRHASGLAKLAQVGDSVAEVVLLNSHDGTSSYQLHAGLFRLVCLNGMVVSDGSFGFKKVGHSGKGVLDKVIDGTFTVLEDAKMAIEHADTLRQITVDKVEERMFGEAALSLRFGEEEMPKIDGLMVTRPRRAADLGGNLWLAFNRTQENLIRGGLEYTNVNDKGQAQHRTTRPVNSIDGDMRLNKALWKLAQGFAELKAGKGALAA